MTTTVLHQMSRGCWCHFPPGLQVGWGAVGAHLLWRRLTGGDFIKVMNESTYQFGPNPIRTAADLRDHRPGSANEASLRDQLDLIRRIVDRVRGSYPVIASIMNPYGHLDTVLGAAHLAKILAEDQAAASTGFMTIAETLGTFARDCVVKAGADAIFFASTGGEASRFDDSTFETAIGRPDRYVLKAARATSPTILHICGAGIAMHRYARHKADAVHWDAANNDPPHGLWKDAIRMPGLNVKGALTTGDRQALAAEAMQMRCIGGPDHTIVTAACCVPVTMPFRRLRAALAVNSPAKPVPLSPIDQAAWHALRFASGNRRRPRTV
jgi:uroporphyrinogen-III decarboxylase